MNPTLRAAQIRPEDVLLMGLLGETEGGGAQLLGHFLADVARGETPDEAAANVREMAAGYAMKLRGDGHRGPMVLCRFRLEGVLETFAATGAAEADRGGAVSTSGRHGGD